MIPSTWSPVSISLDITARYLAPAGHCFSSPSASLTPLCADSYADSNLSTQAEFPLPSCSWIRLSTVLRTLATTWSWCLDIELLDTKNSASMSRNDTPETRQRSIPARFGCSQHAQALGIPITYLCPDYTETIEYSHFFRLRLVSGNSPKFPPIFRFFEPTKFRLFSATYTANEKFLLLFGKFSCKLVFTGQATAAVASEVD